MRAALVPASRGLLNRVPVAASVYRLLRSGRSYCAPKPQRSPALGARNAPAVHRWHARAAPPPGPRRTAAMAAATGDPATADAGEGGLRSRRRCGAARARVAAVCDCDLQRRAASNVKPPLTRPPAATHRHVAPVVLARGEGGLQPWLVLAAAACCCSCCNPSKIKVWFTQITRDAPFNIRRATACLPQTTPTCATHYTQGRGEYVRLAFEEAGVAYVDVAYAASGAKASDGNGGDWGSLAKSPGFKVGGCPELLCFSLLVLGLFSITCEQACWARGWCGSLPVLSHSTFTNNAKTRQRSHANAPRSHARRSSISASPTAPTAATRRCARRRRSRGAPPPPPALRSATRRRCSRS